MKGINKCFGPVQVLYDVDFHVEENEMHALIGENGAGKSTLMKILTGIESYDSGEVYIDGELTHFKSVKDGEASGIAIVNQELNLFPDMTVLENLFINKEPIKFGFIDVKKQKAIAKSIFKKLDITVDYDILVGELSVGIQQMLEIAKALIMDAELIILDEPTSALTQSEIETLFRVLRVLKKEGKSMVYISHRMQEIFDLCDSVTILRDGKFIKRANVNDISFDDVVSNMVGYELGNLFPDKPKVTFGKTIFEAKNLTAKPKFQDISFHVRQGEIIGFAGLMGSGRSEIMNAIFGVEKFQSGELYFEGEQVKINSVEKAKKLGMGYVTENRKDEGLFLDFSITDNILFNNFNKVSDYQFVINEKTQKLVKQSTETVNLKHRDFDQYIYELSGGNQQKVVLAKWLANNPKMLILDEPTRGIDVNSKKQIYELIYDLKKMNIAVILVSSELIELLGIADTIYVMREGKINARLENENITDEVVMKYMMGGAEFASKRSQK